MENQNIQKLDVRGVFKSKNPKLARMMPGFVFRLIEKIVHQDELNAFLERAGSAIGVEFAQIAIKDFNISVKVFGEENLPSSGRFLFAGNHPLGGFDGVVLMGILGKKYGDIRFLVNDILMNIKNLRPVFLPINKHGANSRQAAEMINNAFASDIPMITFPAGLCSRKINGVITDLQWKSNFIKKAVEYKRDIVPVFVEARNSDFFYNLSNFRKKIGIKINIEMFFLPHELCKFRNNEISFYFGKPIPYANFDKSCSLEQWTEYVRGVVYKLKKEKE
jgi:putative hemolysin